MMHLGARSNSLQKTALLCQSAGLVVKAAGKLDIPGDEAG
jgi:hypothetical protein